MKLMHLSDLHLGKRLHERSLLEDQRHMLQSLLASLRILFLRMELKLKKSVQILMCGSDGLLFFMI